MTATINPHGGAAREMMSEMTWRWPDWYTMQHILLTEWLVQRMTLAQIATTKEDECKPVVMRYKVYRLLSSPAATGG